MGAVHQLHCAEQTLTTDGELVEATRQGNMDAYGELWIRYEKSAVNLARRLTRSSVEDIVAESFARILCTLRAGMGPNANFRAYLFATVRSLIIDASRVKYAETVLVGDQDQLAILAGAMAAPEPEDVADFATSSWGSLNERDQWLIWASVIQGYSTPEIGVKLGITSAKAAVWVHRARQRLRLAFLTAQVPATDDPVCAAYRSRFVSYLQGKFSEPRRTEVAGHVASCSPCADAFAAAREINYRMHTGKRGARGLPPSGVDPRCSGQRRLPA